MYRDVKTGEKKKNNNTGIRYGIEIIQTGGNSTLENGSVVPLRGINNEKINEKVKLIADDEIKIGSAIFKVLKSSK